ncbi:MAG: amino acid permease [Firmicutes bacterium]|nr:amino acid permease [Bacillota bacterium]
MTELKRTLGWQHAAAITIGSVLGSGVLILPALTAEVAGPLAIVAWAFLSVLSIPIALTFSRLSTRIPHAGGILAYVAQAFGPALSQAMGWMFIVMYPIGVPIVAIIGADYVGSVVGLSLWPRLALAAAILLISVLLNIRGVQLAGAVQLVLAGLIAVVLVVAIVAAAPHMHASAFIPFAPHGWHVIGTASVLIFWCFVGWEAATNLSEEYRNPERDLALGLIVAVCIVTVLYLALAIVTVGTRAYTGHMGLAPLSELVARGFGPAFSSLTAVLALLITFGTVHTNTASFSRMIYAQARDGHFPRILARLHKRYQTPVSSLLLMGILSLVALCLAGAMRLQLQPFVTVVSVADLAVYIVSLAAALRILRDRGSRLMALSSLLPCVLVYAASGWIMLVPAAILTVGYALARADQLRRLVGGENR